MEISTKKWKQKLSVFLIVSMIMQTAGVTALAEEGSLVEKASKVITATSSNAKRHVQTASDADTATDSDLDEDDEYEDDEFDLIDDLDVGLATPFNARAVSGNEVEVSTYTELINAVKNASAGDTVILADDIDATSSASLAVTKNITVNGNGHTLDGKNQYGFFVIKSGGFLNLQDITIANAKQNSKRASVIYTYGSQSGDGASLENCTIIGNSSSKGAIYISGGREFQMVNCTVADNPGIAVSLSSANAVLANNIIVGSSTDVSASNVTDEGYNLVGSASSGQFTEDTSVVSSKLDNHDEWLTSADDYDPEEMGLPLIKTVDNPALDKIPADNAYLPDTDQRGIDRPKNELGDIGAYELNEYSLITYLNLGTPEQNGSTLTIPYEIGGEEGDNFNYGIIWSVTAEDGSELSDTIKVVEDEKNSTGGTSGNKKFEIVSPEAVSVKITAASLTNEDITADLTAELPGNPARYAELLIDEIPDKIARKDKELLEGIRADVTALMEQYRVTESEISNWDKLIQAEARLKQLEEQQGNITTVDELKEALTNAEEGDTLYLKGDIELTGSTTSTYQFAISKSVTIEGNGYAIDGGGAFSLFQVTGGSDLTLRNLTLRNAYRNTKDSYGACAVAVTSGGVTMENCVLTGNKSVYSKYSGFIVYVASSQKLTMKNCTVMGNEQKNSNYAAFYIGRGASGIIANTVFGGNTSTYSSKYNFDVYFSTSGTNIVDGGYNRFSDADNATESGFGAETSEISKDYSDLSSWVDEDGSLIYSSENPLIDQIPADNTYLTSEDIFGISRPQNAKGDIGAAEFEFAQLTTFTVDKEAELTAASGGELVFPYAIGGEESGVYDFSLNWSACYANGKPLDESITAEGLGDDQHEWQNGEISLSASRSITFHSVKNADVVLTVVSNANPDLTKTFTIHVTGDPVQYVENLIAQIPDVDAITLADKDQINSISKKVTAWMEKYGLDAAAISNYSRLSDALARLAELEAGLPVINTAAALLDAITDAQSGSTIYITGDIELDAMSSASLKYRDSSKTLTIEGNGHEINFNNKSGFMYIGIDRITIRDLTFKNAKMSNYDGSVLSLRDSTKALIENCNFINNRSAKKGGAIDINSTSKAEFKNCTFAGNESGLYGGAIYQTGTGDLSLENCVFYDNSSWQYGGAVYSSNGNSKLEIVHCSFASNQADESGSGLYLSGPNTVVANSIVVGNENEYGEKNDIYLADGSAQVDGGYNLIGSTNVDSNFKADGTIVNASYADYSSWLDDNMEEEGRVLTLKPVSYNPAIDKIVYNNKWLTASDRDGNTRPYNGRGDIGAYENVQDVSTVDAISSATINEQTSSALQVNSGESFVVKSAVRADRENVDLSSKWEAQDENGEALPDGILVTGLETPDQVEDADDEMSRMEVRNISIVSLKDRVVKLVMSSTANPDMKTELNVSVEGGNFDLNNKDLADMIVREAANIAFSMKQSDAVSEDVIQNEIRQKIWEKYGTEFPLTIEKISYTEAVKGSVGALAGTNGQYAFRVVLSGGSGETAYRTQSNDLVMTITATPYMSDENAQNVLTLELVADRITKQLPALRIKAGATKEEAKALAEEAVKAFLPEGVSANVEIIAFQSSDTAQEGVIRFCYHLQAGEGAAYAERTSDTFTMVMEKARKSSGGSSGSGGSGGGGGSRSVGSTSSTEQHHPSVVDEQAQWVQNGTDWKLTLSSGETAADRWVQKNGHWYWFKADGIMAHSEWVSYMGHWYYLNAGGDMIAGWLFWNEHWYYLKPDGIMAADEMTPDGYKIGPDGIWVQ